MRATGFAPAALALSVGAAAAWRLLWPLEQRLAARRVGDVHARLDAAQDELARLRADVAAAAGR